MFQRTMIFVLAMVAMSSALPAALVYDFRLAPSATEVLPGQQTINVYLDQTATGVDTANLHTVGLGTANFTINSSDASISFSAVTGFVDNGLDVFATTDLSTSGSAIFNQVSFLNPGTIATGTLATGGSASFSSLLIGTISFNLATGQSTTLSTALFAAGDFDLADTTPVVAINGTSLTISAVPEPTSLGLISLVGMGAAFWRRCRSYRGIVAG